MRTRQSQKRLLNELLEKYGPEIAAAFRESINDLRSGADIQRVILALERGDLEDALKALHLDRAAYEPLEAKIREAFISAGQATAQTLPKAVAIGFRFNVGNPAAEAWLRSHSSDLVTGILDDQRAAVREALASGMARGAHPRAAAMDIVGRVSSATGLREGGILGLSGPQRTYVESARLELASSDPKMLAHYLTRGRRDRRFDRSVLKAIREGRALDPAMAAQAVASYRNRLERLRAEVIGRTEALTSVRTAKQETYRQLVASGAVDEADVKKTWLSAGDRRVRHTHAALDGQQVGLNDNFTSPSGALMLHPGDTSQGAGAEEVIACRCDFSFQIKKAAA